MYTQRPKFWFNSPGFKTKFRPKNQKRNNQKGKPEENVKYIFMFLRSSAVENIKITVEFFRLNGDT